MPEQSSAGVDAGYLLAQSIIARAGRTYYLASRLLPADARRAVFALYGFARMVDDVVDGDRPPADAAAMLDAIDDGLAAALSGARPARTAPPITPLSADQQNLLAALADTTAAFGIDPDTYAAFLHSMRMDVPGTPEFRSRYADFTELGEYMYGSAAVIGLQMLPVLGAPPTAGAGAALLGEAFQLTNFLRDVAEDLARDRIYLPADQLSAFGVDEAVLRTDAAARQTSAPLRRALAHLMAINRDQYRRAAGAVAALPPRTRPAIAAAASSYAAILDEIEASGYDVMARRAVVPTHRRLRHAAAAALRGRR